MNEPTGTLLFPEMLIVRPGEPPYIGWGIRLLGAQVDAIGPREELLARYPQDERWDAPEQVASPGFVDAHTHLTALLAHGLMDASEQGEPFPGDPRWRGLAKHLDRLLVDAAVESGAFHSLRSGVTSLAELVDAPHPWPGLLGAIAARLTAYGLRALLGLLAVDTRGLAAITAFLARDQRHLSGHWVRGCVAVNKTDGPDREFQEQARALARRARAPYLAHTTDWLQVVELPGGRFQVFTPLRPGLRGELPGAAVLRPEDAATTGLGSDGASFDFFRVMRSAQRHSRYQDTPRRLAAGLIWRMATEGGARALGFGQVGRLEPGWQADLVLIDLNFPGPVTPENLYDQLLRYGSPEHVQAVLVAGHMRVCHGVVLDVDAETVRRRGVRAALEWARRMTSTAMSPAEPPP